MASFSISQSKNILTYWTVTQGSNRQQIFSISPAIYQLPFEPSKSTSAWDLLSNQPIYFTFDRKRKISRPVQSFVAIRKGRVKASFGKMWVKFWEPSGTHLSRKGYNLCSLISSQVFCFCNYYQNRIKTLLVHTCFTLECLKRENNSVTLLNQGRWRLCV